MTKKIFFIAMFSLIIGFSVGHLFNNEMNKVVQAEISSNNNQFETPSDNYEMFMNTINPGGIFFFKHNIMFFLVLTILPIVNVVIMMLQIIVTGIDIGFIQDLSFDVQFMLLYRHLFFEFIALILAVSLGNKFLQNMNMVIVKQEINKRKLLFEVATYYSAIIICTIIAATLEGSAHV